jgi:hypothetical protein
MNYVHIKSKWQPGGSLGPRLRRPRLKPGVYRKTRAFGMTQLTPIAAFQLSQKAYLKSYQVRSMGCASVLKT